MTDTPMLDRAIAHSTAAPDHLVGSPLLPAPESLADDIMVAAAFLQTEADRLAQLAGITPATPGERHSLAAAATFQARADRLFAHARDLARAEAAPATAPVDVEIDQDWALTITIDLTDDQIRLLAALEDRFREAQLATSAAIYADTGEQPSTYGWPFLIDVKDRATAIRVGRTDAP